MPKAIPNSNVPDNDTNDFDFSLFIGIFLIDYISPAPIKTGVFVNIYYTSTNKNYSLFDIYIKTPQFD